MSNPTKPTKGVKFRSEEYYFTNMIFQVDDCLYNVPINAFLEQSQSEGPFHTLVSLPSGDKQKEGSTELQPVKLQGILKADFENLLRVLYPRGPVAAQHTTSRWLSVLRLAHMWEMDKLFKLAVAEVLKHPAEPVLMLQYAAKYSIEEWLEPAYTMLAARKDPLSEAEAERIGVQATVKIFHTRESRGDRLGPWTVDDEAYAYAPASSRPTIRRRLR